MSESANPFEPNVLYRTLLELAGGRSFESSLEGELIHSIDLALKAYFDKPDTVWSRDADGSQCVKYAGIINTEELASHLTAALLGKAVEEFDG